jgi:hypothetical protein
MHHGCVAGANEGGEGSAMKMQHKYEYLLPRGLTDG